MGNIFGAMTKKQKTVGLTSIIQAILSTDMSQHFTKVKEINALVSDVEEQIEFEKFASEEGASQPSLLSRMGSDTHSELREKFLPFVLHMADISNPTKTIEVSSRWVEQCYAEFFKQGDLEAEEDIPISPLCDRRTTNKPEAQIGFMKFVVRPSFEQLARCIPAVESVILTQHDANLKYWEGEKGKLANKKKQEGERGEEGGSKPE